MNSDKASSSSSSGETSGTKPPPPDAPPEKLTEAQFLAQQAHNAQLAMSKAWQEMKARLGQGTNPAAWAHEYPWITVGAAAVAGFAAAATLVPSKEQQALKRLARIERALHPPAPRADHGNGNGDSKKEEHGGMLSTILHEAIAVLRPALVSLMTAGLAANPAAQQGEVQAASDASDEPQDYYGGT